MVRSGPLSSRARVNELQVNVKNKDNNRVFFYLPLTFDRSVISVAFPDVLKSRRAIQQVYGGRG